LEWEAGCREFYSSRSFPLFTKSPFQVYVTGNAFVILRSFDTILQTIYGEDDTPLDAIAFDEAYGKIASCAGHVIRIYKPYGQSEDTLKVRHLDDLDGTVRAADM
jgi:hypothetical protein